jgi:hypothetical protein
VISRPSVSGDVRGVTPKLSSCPNWVSRALSNSRLRRTTIAFAPRRRRSVKRYASAPERKKLRPVASQRLAAVVGSAAELGAITARTWPSETVVSSAPRADRSWQKVGRANLRARAVPRLAVVARGEQDLDHPLVGNRCSRSWLSGGAHGALRRDGRDRG